jgi:hypothetical protein
MDFQLILKPDANRTAKLHCPCCLEWSLAIDRFNAECGNPDCDRYQDVIPYFPEDPIRE